MAWIESHQTLREHPKTKMLARRLGISRVAAIGHLHCLWWWALDYAQDGDLSKYDAVEIAEGAQWDDEAEDFIDALIESGFLDSDWSIHDWNGGRHTRPERGLMRREWDAMAARVRPLIFERDGYHCCQCDAEAFLEVDHVLAIANGGTNDTDNLQTLCRSCNRRKGAN